MCYCDPSNPFTGKSCGKEKCRPWEYQEAMRELTAERDALKAELDIEKNRRELAEEEIEVLGMNLDDIGLPRKTSDTLSIWGRVTFLLDNISSMRAEIEAARKQEPIGSVTVQRWRGIDSMINTDFDAVQNLPDGTYQCYASPVPAQQPDSALEQEIKRLVAMNDSLLANEQRLIERLYTAEKQSGEVTPAMLRAAQLQSELGVIACSKMAGAYSLITELYEVMHNASLKGGENEQNQEENTIDAWYARMKGKYL